MDGQILYGCRWGRSKVERLMWPMCPRGGISACVLLASMSLSIECKAIKRKVSWHSSLKALSLVLLISGKRGKCFTANIGKSSSEDRSLVCGNGNGNGNMTASSKSF